MFGSFDFRYGEYDAETIFQSFFDTLLGELAKNALNQLFVRFLLLYIFHPQFFSALVFCRLSFHLLMLLENYF